MHPGDYITGILLKISLLKNLHELFILRYEYVTCMQPWIKFARQFKISASIGDTITAIALSIVSIILQALSILRLELCQFSMHLTLMVFFIHL